MGMELRKLKIGYEPDMGQLCMWCDISHLSHSRLRPEIRITYSNAVYRGARNDSIVI